MSEKNKQEVYEVTVTETLERVVCVKADSMVHASFLFVACHATINVRNRNILYTRMQLMRSDSCV